MKARPPQSWTEVTRLFEAALGLLPNERNAFLERACAGDAELRREVQSLLEADVQAGKFMRVAAYEGETPSTGPTWHADSNGELPAGHCIGAYKLIREIAHGGMGTVYLALRADESYRKRVAIKLIRRGMDTDSILRRFKNERQILASLDHPNIAKLLDGGTTADGLPYFVMEYVEGEPLLEYCDSHRLSIQARLRLFGSICSAVHYAHQNLIVHRDLKTKNVLVTSDGIPKLLDFGIAKFLKPELCQQTLEITAPAVMVMTPEYASPEQVRGEPVTIATDVYSLGVLLYELLTGHPPYRFGRQAPDEIARVICEQVPEKPSVAVSRIEEISHPNLSDPISLTPESVSKARDARPEQLRRQLRGDLDNIVLKALRKEPNRRYASAEQFSEDIRRHLENLPISARHSELLYRIGKHVRRHKTRALATGVIVLAFAAAAITAWLERKQGSPVTENAVQSLAVLPLVYSKADPNLEYFFDGITESIINGLSQLPRLRVMGRWTSFRFKGREVNPQNVGRDLGVDAVLTGSAMQQGDVLILQVELTKTADGTQLWGDRYHRRIAEIFVLQEEIARAVAQKLRSQLTHEQEKRVVQRYTDNEEAYKAYLRGRYFWNKRTEEGINKAIKHFQAAIEIDPTYALAYAGMASCYAVLPSYDPVASEAGYAQGKAAAYRALEMDPTLSDAWTALALIHLYYDWDFPAVEREFTQALELNPNDATTHQWHGFFLTALGRFDEAVSEMQLALKLEPLSTIINNNLGRILYFARRYPQAIEQFQKTLELDKDFLPAHYEIGSAYVESGMYQEAIQEWTLEHGPRGLARRAYAAARSGDKSGALAAVDALKAISDQRDIPALIALLYVALGNHEQALDWLEKAYERSDDWLVFLKVEPEFDPLRRQPRFEALLKRLRLVETF